MIDSQHSVSDTRRVLLLGGTSEASAMARALAGAGVDAVFSYAGRTAAPVAQPLPTRVGGFGGVEGLGAYLRDEGITHVIDATHPFAAQMSRHAVAACAEMGVPLVGFERESWRAGPGDDWHGVPDMESALAALPDRGARVFLAIGKQNLDLFAGKPDNFYLLRLVDAPSAALPFPDAVAVIDRGPFSEAGDLALLRDHAITHIVAKNAGGTGAAAKLAAARQLGLPVILIERPLVPARRIARTVEQVMEWLAGHPAALSADLGV